MLLKRGRIYMFITNGYENSLKKRFKEFVLSIGLNSYGILRKKSGVIDAFYLELYESERDVIGRLIPERFEFYRIEVNYVEYKFIK